MGWYPFLLYAILIIEQKMKQKLFVIKFLPLIACLLVFNISCSYSHSENNAAVGASLAEGDEYLFNNELTKAQEVYELALEKDPDNHEALWRLSRCYVWQGMTAKKAKDKKKKWKKAAEYARRGIEANPNSAESHAYVAIAVGKCALYSSGGAKVKASREIKEMAEKAIELDPVHYKAHLALGAWHRNVATASSFEKQLAKMFFGELPEATLEESLEFLLKSINLGGDSVKNYYELALTYEAIGDYEHAKTAYKNALTAPSVYPNDIEIKEEIKNTLMSETYEK